MSRIDRLRYSVPHCHIMASLSCYSGYHLGTVYIEYTYYAVALSTALSENAVCRASSSLFSVTCSQPMLARQPKRTPTAALRGDAAESEKSTYM